MFVFKIKKGNTQIIELSEQSFVRATQKKYPYYQEVKDTVRHYAICPGCENPVSVVNLHVDRPLLDENQRKVTLHARHVKKSVEGIGEYDQAAYDRCPYAKPSSSIGSKKRQASNETNEILWLVRHFPDALNIIIKRDIGISLSEGLFTKMLQTFKKEDGHLYRYVSKVNLPYAFVYMSNNQSLWEVYLDSRNSFASEIKTALNTNAKFCWINKHGYVKRKEGIKGYVDVSFYFRDFIYEVEDYEKQGFTFVITEKYQGKENEVFQRRIEFDQYYYFNMINKRKRFLFMANSVYS